MVKERRIFNRLCLDTKSFCFSDCETIVLNCDGLVCELAVSELVGELVTDLVTELVSMYSTSLAHT